jgi:predicted phosphodiesterase
MEMVDRETVYDGIRALLTDIRNDGERSRNEGRAFDDWTPDVIAISGDLGWSGVRADYDEVERLLRDLSAILDIESDRIVACPGNHDRDVRIGGGIKYPESAKEADELISPDVVRQLADGDASAGAAPYVPPIFPPFAEYVRFCERLGLRKPELGLTTPVGDPIEGLTLFDYLSGRCAIEVRECMVEFLILNSAWFANYKAEGASDVRNMWLGQRLLAAMRESKGFYSYKLAPKTARSDGGDPDPGPKWFRVGLCHHPRDWLHEDEHDSYSLRENTYRMIATECDLLLHGHVHGALEPPTRSYGGAETYTGGASYAGGHYRNNFSILQVNLDDRSVRRRGYEYDPREPQWEHRREADHTSRLRDRHTARPREESQVSLAGLWKSVFWQEYKASTNKPVEWVLLHEGDRDGWFSTSDWPSWRKVGLDDAGDSTEQPELQRISIRGYRRHGYFTGLWQDHADGRYGGFQFKVLAGAVELEGRWVGFDSEDNVLGGYWRLARADVSQDEVPEHVRELVTDSLDA